MALTSFPQSLTKPPACSNACGESRPEFAVAKRSRCHSGCKNWPSQCHHLGTEGGNLLTTWKPWLVKVFNIVQTVNQCTHRVSQ
jgi:hypothetical protein